MGDPPASGPDSSSGVSGSSSALESSALRRWRRFPAEVGAAWALGPVRQGFAGTFAIALGSFTPAYLPQASPLWEPLRAIHFDGTAAKFVGTLIVIAGIWCLVDGWFRLRRSISDEVTAPAILAIWSVPFLPAPPIFSHDAYSYGAQGWLIHNGINPYEAGPGALPGAFADLVAWVWRYTPAPYGPLSLQIQHGLVDLSGFHPMTAALLMRIPALIGVALIVALLPRITRRLGYDPRPVAWFACLNPLLVIDFVGGAHNDALMMGLVVAALWLACRPGAWPLAAVVVGIAAAIKQPAFLAAYILPLVARPIGTWPDPRLLARSARKQGSARVAAIVKAAGDFFRIAPWRLVFAAAGWAVVSLAVAVATFVLVSWACGLGFGWIDAVDVPGMATTVSPSTLVGEAVQFVVDPGHRGYIRFFRGLGIALGFGLAVLFAVVIAPREPFRALAWGWLAIAFGAPALHSWYVLWGTLILPLPPGRRIPRVAVVVVIVLLCYGAINLAWRNGNLALGIAAIGVFAWAVYYNEWRRRRGARGKQASLVSPS
ncbi:MAG: polyprenol phosphomannose-dependent alpha 1,6 mannosyltransferase MptB [Propionibacteriaceae bacterium]|jgi:alpha-1,6-mannosyltransferase|nr:polyprenol phosphomannose-dependent alpha 1,6 mannosyltransferase MptB [Propionibacteriaceae bacterium]